MEKQIKKRKIITAIAVILLTAVYIMIFSFSADDADTSSAISLKVTKWLMNLYYGIFHVSGGNAVIIPMVTDEAENIVRKLAHFTEYMAVGCLSFGIALMWIKGIARGVIIVLIQLILSAGLDEIHQYFVPGRHSAVKDVVIDTAGGIAGMIIIFCAKKIKDHFS